MSFAAPWALIGLLAAGLPLLLHLIRRHEASEVLFPAVRYLQDMTRREQRRLALRNWLLLLLRTLLIVMLVLAAAGMTIQRVRIGPHAPSALVLIVDNSAASGVIVDGAPLLDALRRAANRVLDQAGSGDRLWLVAADGIVRTGSAAELRQHVAALQGQPSTFDIGRAISSARALLAGSNRPHQVVVVSALPAALVQPATGNGSLLVLHPAVAMPSNRAITSLTASLQPWSTSGGTVYVTVAATDSTQVPLSIGLDGRPLRDVLVTPGATDVERIGALGPGWHVVTAALAPDELRIDDAASTSVHVVPPPAVAWDTTDRFVNAAAQVLAADGRIAVGNAVRFGTLGPGPSIVLPPVDPAEIPAVNRALAARGSAWQFGTPVLGHEATDTSAWLQSRDSVTHRYTVVQHGNGDVLATVDGAPWLVRSGNVMLLGSRIDPAWTGLPLSAAFIPFLDAMLTSAVRGAFVSQQAVVGSSVALPSSVTAMTRGNRAAAVSGMTWTPAEPGIYYALVGTDTVGAISVRVDPRVARLRRATDAEIATAWPGASARTLDDGPRFAFASVVRGDLRALLLVIALCCALGEWLVTGRVPRPTRAV